MRGASALGKEWYEHSEGFCDALKGKTRDRDRRAFRRRCRPEGSVYHLTSPICKRRRWMPLS